MQKAIIKIIIFSLLLTALPTPRIASAALISRAPNNLGLVGYWPMDEGVGTQVGDASGNRNAGTITGATWTNGKHGKAMSFNGTTDYIDVGDKDIYSFTNGSSDLPFTLSAWVYYVAPYAGANNPTFPIISKYNNSSPFDGEWNFDVVYPSVLGGPGNDHLIFQMLETTALDRMRIESQVSIPRSTWTYVSMVYDGTELTTGVHLYVNGSEVAVNTNSLSYTGMTNRSSPVRIGSELNGSATYKAFANGKIDDVRIYNRALSATEISKLYSSGGVKLTKVSNSGLVGYWPMDEGRGNKVGDSSGKGNTGNITGATWTNGERGKALSFDGNDYVEMGTASLNINDKMSVSAWVKASADTNGRIVSKHGTSNYGWMLTRSAASDLFEWRISTNGSDWNGGESSYNSFVIGQWYHVVSVYDGSFMRIYINGREDTTGQFPFALSGNVNNSNGRTLIAKADWPGGNLFSGLIDDVRIYNRALTATEIQSLYKQNSTTLGTSYENRLTNGLVGFWTMNGKDISGTTVLDKSGQGNNGTLTNMTATSSTAIGKLGQALSFDKVDDGLNVGSAAVLDNLTALSYCAWIKPNTFGQLFIGAIVSKGFTKYFGITDLNKLNFTVQYDGTDLSIYSTSNIIYRTWSHVCATWSGGASANNATLYINGSSVAVTGSDGTGSPSYDGSSICYVGNIGSTRTFDGLIDEVRIYNRALSADEVKQLYKMGQ